MELHMQSHQFTHRMPDWRAAAIGGLIAGVVFLVLEMLMVGLIMGGSVWTPPRMIAAIVMGRGALPPPETFDAAILVAALGVHFVLAAIFGAILGLIIAPFRFDSSVGMASVVGAVFGLALYLVNFYGMTQFFPWFAEARNWASMIAHLVFGVAAADAYLQLERKEDAKAS